MSSITEGQIAPSYWRMLIARWSAHRKAQRTRAELSTLSDRRLNDIGLKRADIWSVSKRCAGL